MRTIILILLSIVSLVTGCGKSDLRVSTHEADSDVESRSVITLAQSINFDGKTKEQLNIYVQNPNQFGIPRLAQAVEMRNRYLGKSVDLTGALRARERYRFLKTNYGVDLYNYHYPTMTFDAELVQLMAELQLIQNSSPAGQTELKMHLSQMGMGTFTLYQEYIYFHPHNFLGLFQWANASITSVPPSDNLQRILMGIIGSPYASAYEVDLVRNVLKSVQSQAAIISKTYDMKIAYMQQKSTRIDQIYNLIFGIEFTINAEIQQYWLAEYGNIN